MSLSVRKDLQKKNLRSGLEFRYGTFPTQNLVKLKSVYVLESII